jgi:hypothetical protein
MAGRLLTEAVGCDIDRSAQFLNKESKSTPSSCQNSNPSWVKNCARRLGGGGFFAPTLGQGGSTMGVRIDTLRSRFMAFDIAGECEWRRSSSVLLTGDSYRLGPAWDYVAKDGE